MIENKNNYLTSKFTISFTTREVTRVTFINDTIGVICNKRKRSFNVDRMCPLLTENKFLSVFGSVIQYETVYKG